MIEKPADEWSPEEWATLHRRAFELSTKLLTTVEDQESTDGTYSVQVAGFALLIAMGRLSGKHGYRHLGFDEVWKLWTDDAAKKQVRVAFEAERRSEN